MPNRGEADKAIAGLNGKDLSPGVIKTPVGIFLTRGSTCGKDISRRGLSRFSPFCPF
jgi:hypothetical protein